MKNVPQQFQRHLGGHFLVPRRSGDSKVFVKAPISRVAENQMEKRSDIEAGSGFVGFGTIAAGTLCYKKIVRAPHL